MAIAYLAEDLKHERRVAIKVLAPQLAFALGPDRLLREIKLTATLHHPHILAHALWQHAVPVGHGGDDARDQFDLYREEGVRAARSVVALSP